MAASLNLLLQLILTTLLPLFFFFALPINSQGPAYFSFPLTNRDAHASLIRAQEADPSDLPQDMPLRDFVAAGRAMKAREERRRSAKAGGPHNIVGRFSYLDRPAVGDFYLSTSVGNPPQHLTFTLDTGSELVFTKCKPCQKCPKSTKVPLFAYDKSSSYMKVPCDPLLCLNSVGVKTECNVANTSSGICSFTSQYGDGTKEQGHISVDSFHLTKETSKPIMFGCAVHDEDPVGMPASGIMGLTAGPFSFSSQLFAGNSKLPNKFAHCLPDRLKHLNSLGTIIFGDYTLPSKLSYTPLIPPYAPLAHLFYFVQLEGITVGRKFIKSTMKQEGTKFAGTVFDSGTALTHLEGSLYSNLVAEMKKQTSHLHPFSKSKGFASDLCYKVPLDSEGPPKVPLTIMHFAGGARLELGPGSVLFANGGVDDKHFTMCLAFQVALPNVPLNIIGNHQQQNYWVEYNLQTLTVGLAKAKCATK